MKLRPVEAEILIKALAKIRLMLSSKCPGVGMISPSMPKRDRNPRLYRKLRF